MRSILLVSPHEDDFSAALASGTDAIALDLGAAAAPDREEMRARAGALIARARGAGPRLYARVAPLSEASIDGDLEAVAAAGADGILLPEACGGASVQHLSAKLAVREAECGRPDGALRIIALATQTPAAVFALGTYAGASSRLEALVFDVEPLGRRLGAQPETGGTLSATFQAARAGLLLAAAAAGVPALDRPSAARDEAVLAADCRAARRDGFRGKLAIDVSQIRVIEGAFSTAAP